MDWKKNYHACIKAINKVKNQLIGRVTLILLDGSFLETILCYCSSNHFLKNQLKVRVFPLACTYILDKPEIRIAKIGNYRFYVNIAEYAGVSLYFFNEHSEPFSAWLVSSLVNEGDVCIDIGANAGSYTFLMASSAGIQVRYLLLSLTQLYTAGFSSQ